MSGFNPIALEIMWNRMINITEECWITIWRTAFSMVIGEAQDFGVELMDWQGNSIAHSPRSMPVFNLTLPRAVKALLARFPAETLREGDVLITNDPWACAGHLYDLALVTPVFHKGELVGLVGAVGHVSDIGGTLDAFRAREVYEEGLQIPPTKLYDQGRPNETLFDIILANVRKGEMVIGDVQAMVTANQVGADRLVAFMEEYHLESLEELATVVQERAETAMRDAIRAVPDGVYTHEVFFDGIGEPLKLPVKVTVNGDLLEVDWEGAPAQLSRGGINCTFNYTAAHTTYVLKCILTPEVPSNAGCFRPITVKAPEGSILNCRYPASVSVRTMTGWSIAPAVFGALAPALPERVQSYTGLPIAATVYGEDSRGRVYNDHLFQGGGQGAGLHGDGKSGLLYPTSAANVSVEMFETRVPMLVQCKEFIADSGGAGRRRGGLGQRIRLRKLREDGKPALMGIHPQGMIVATPGLYGGQAGGRANVRVEEPSQVVEGVALAGMAEVIRMDQVVTVELAGGSGYGDPQERSLGEVQADLDGGYITQDGARVYGVRVTAEGKAVR